MSAYLLPSVVFPIPAGLLADRFGRRGFFVGSMMLFGLSGAAALLVNTFSESELLVLRMFQGAAFAAILPLSLTILGDTVSGRTQVSQQGVRAVLITSGDMLWALIGGGLALVYWSAPLAGSAVALPLALLGWKWLNGALAKAFEPVEASKARAAMRLMFSAFKTRIGLSVQFAGFARFLFKYALFALVPVLLFQRGFSTLFISSVLAASAAIAMASAAASPLGLRMVRSSTLLAYVLLAFAAAFALVSVTKNPATIVVAMMVFGLAEGAFSVIRNAMLLTSCLGVIGNRLPCYGGAGAGGDTRHASASPAGSSPECLSRTKRLTLPYPCPRPLRKIHVQTILDTKSGSEPFRSWGPALQSWRGIHNVGFTGDQPGRPFPLASISRSEQE